MRVALLLCAVLWLGWSIVEPASARPLRTSSVAGWRITAEPEANSRRFAYCKATSTARGAVLSFALTREMKWDAQVEFDGWELAPDRNFDVYLALDPDADGPIYKVAATATGARQIVANLAPRLSEDNELFVAFRRLNVLTVLIDDQTSPKVEYQLTGTVNALPALMRCVSQFGGGAVPAAPQPVAQDSHADDAAQAATSQ
jgi:hypothetical protein